MTTELEEIFFVVSNRIKMKRDSLRPIKKFPTSGIEGWLKVEVVASLERTRYAVKKLNNKGPDLLLENNMMIELKAATDFNVPFIIKRNLEKRNSMSISSRWKQRRKNQKISI